MMVRIRQHEMIGLYRECSNLFRRVLSRADHNDLDVLMDEDHIVDVDQSSLLMRFHLDPSAINRKPRFGIVQLYSQ